jgi:ATP-binding cassette subfamily B protein/subfamily B ATP-binding cassette protein MsbA
VLFVLGVISVSAALSQNFLTRRLLGSFVTQMRRRLMKHLLRMPLHRLQQMKVGGIVSRLQSDTEMMRGLLQEGLITPLNAILMFGVALVSLTILSWKIMLVWLVFTAMLFGIAYILFRIMKPFQKALREELAAISAHATEIFAGMNVVRAFVRERAEGRVYAGATHLLWRKSLLAGDLNALAHQGVRTIFWLLHISMWLIGGLQHIHDPAALPLGSLVAFISFVTWLFMPIFMIMGSLATLQVSMACAERVFDLLDEPVGMPDAPDAVDVPGFERAIRFETVSFDYPDGTRALDRLDLSIPKGKVTALVGPSGAGKSTVVNLVLRFYDATEGEILLDGTDIRRYTLASYRRLMSLVLQDVFLFDGTVRENITYGNPDAPDEEVHEAARVANAHEFIVQLDRGYDAYVGERGVKLSGGQKQRIALARAVLTNPEILVLDEATSNLDAESEALIQDALRRIFRERTTLVIAHRLSTILDADTIAVLDGGRKIEEGSHEELLARQGRYHDLYTRQMMQAEDATTFDWGGE